MNHNITYLKAIGIILMAMDHGACPERHVLDFNAMFHMPLFFIVSGYCFKDKYLASFPTFLKRRAKGLYVPFVKWGVLFALLRPLFFALHIYDAEYGFHGVGAAQDDIVDTLHSCWIIVTQMRGTDWLLGGYWFLNALFFGSLVAWGILRLCHGICKKKARLQGRQAECAVAMSLALVAVVHATNFHIVFLNLNTRTFVAAFFFIAGYTLKMKRVPCMGYTAICVSTLFTAVASLYWSMPLDRTRYESWTLIPFCLTAVLATWNLYSIFEKLQPKGLVHRLLSYTGENTLNILTWHLLSFKFVSLVIILTYHLPIERMGEYPVMTEYSVRGWWLLYTITGVVLPLLVNKPIKSYAKRFSTQ